jgi:superfamily I DNA/RNA helicase
MVDPSTQSLLVLYDDAQAIYRSKGGKKALDFSFASVGIQAQGRTTILKLNYRNTVEILAVARAFATELLTSRDASEDGVPLIAPESAGRRGPFPELIQCGSDREEWDLLIARIRDEQANGRQLSDMAILYRSTSQAYQAAYELKKVAIPYRSGASNKGRAQLYDAEDSVKIVSMHSSKGLEFGLVLIPGLGEMPRQGEPEANEARLLYVAMTRAIDRLVMSYQISSTFTSKLRPYINQPLQTHA